MWVVVLLALVWVVALAPTVVRKIRDRDGASSVVSFSRSVARLSGTSAAPDRGGSVPGVAIGYSAAAQRLAENRLGSDYGAISWGAIASTGHDALGGIRTAAPGSAVLVSRATTIRRRRVVATLGAVTLLAFAIGFGVSTFFFVALAGFVLSIAYFVLLAYFHRLAVERAQKVVAFETRLGVALALDHARSTCGSAATTGAIRPKIGGNAWSVTEDSADSPRYASASR